MKPKKIACAFDCRGTGTYSQMGLDKTRRAIVGFKRYCPEHARREARKAFGPMQVENPEMWRLFRDSLVQDKAGRILSPEEAQVALRAAELAGKK